MFLFSGLRPLRARFCRPARRGFPADAKRLFFDL
jgi:hypothetical protein